MMDFLIEAFFETVHFFSEDIWEFFKDKIESVKVKKRLNERQKRS